MNKLTRLSKLLKILLLVLLVISVFWGCAYFLSKSNGNNAKYAFVISYLNDTYGGDYKIKKCSMQHYDYGITGGLYMYRFSLVDKDGKRYVATYDAYWPLSEESVDKLKLSKE